MDIFDVDSFFAQMALALGGALIVGNGYALLMARRGMRPARAEGELRRGRAWFLISVGALIAVWGLASLWT